MNILVLNSGSTSVKFKLFSLIDLNLEKEGEFENVEDYQVTMRQILRQVGDVSEIQAVGHRVVHGGVEYYETTLVTDQVLKSLEKYNELAPLHNPYNLAGIKVSREYLPHLENFAVFDTAFYRHLPLKAKMYALPKGYYEEQGIQRFGFHGISHEYAARQACQEICKPFDRAKLITVHLGGGASITAVDRGKAVDTSMGFTPLEGLVMLTRSGDLDPGIVLELIKRAAEDKQEALKEVSELLNKNSGIKGISGVSDFLELLKKARVNDQAKLALEIFAYRIKKYIGAYWTVLNGADGIVFTGKVGAGLVTTRQKILNNMDFLKNVALVVVKPNEEFLIAQKVKEALAK